MVGYWQVKLDRDLSFLCRFSIPWVSGIRQCNCDFIENGDMIITVSTEQQHHEIMRKGMEGAEQVRVEFKLDKMLYKC